MVKHDGNKNTVSIKFLISSRRCLKVKLCQHFLFTADFLMAAFSFCVVPHILL